MFDTITIAELDSVTGGKSALNAGVCNRQQFDFMAAHQVPENVLRAGFARHVVVADAKRCGFPVPPPPSR